MVNSAGVISRTLDVRDASMFFISELSPKTKFVLTKGRGLAVFVTLCAKAMNQTCRLALLFMSALVPMKDIVALQAEIPPVPLLALS